MDKITRAQEYADKLIDEATIRQVGDDKSALNDEPESIKKSEEDLEDYVSMESDELLEDDMFNEDTTPHEKKKLGWMGANSGHKDQTWTDSKGKNPQQLNSHYDKKKYFNKNMKNRKQNLDFNHDIWKINQKKKAFNKESNQISNMVSNIQSYLGEDKEVKVSDVPDSKKMIFKINRGKARIKGGKLTKAEKGGKPIKESSNSYTTDDLDHGGVRGHEAKKLGIEKRFSGSGKVTAGRHIYGGKAKDQLKKHFKNKVGAETDYAMGRFYGKKAQKSSLKLKEGRTELDFGGVRGHEAKKLGIEKRFGGSGKVTPPNKKTVYGGNSKKNLIKSLKLKDKAYHKHDMAKFNMNQSVKNSFKLKEADQVATAQQKDTLFDKLERVVKDSGKLKPTITKEPTTEGKAPVTGIALAKMRRGIERNDRNLKLGNSMDPTAKANAKKRKEKIVEGDALKKLQSWGKKFMGKKRKQGLKITQKRDKALKDTMEG